MKKRSIFLIAILSIIFCFIWFVSIKTSLDEMGPFSLTVSINGDNQIIKSYYNESDDTYYYFMPSFFKDSTITFNKKPIVDTCINEVPIREFNSSDISFDQRYEIEEGNKTEHVVFMHSENIPSVFIETKSKDKTIQLEDNKANSEVGVMSLITSNGDIEYHGDIKISGRGNTSWDLYDKKPWGITLDKETSLLGMTKSTKWVLLANAGDDTLGLRNYTAYNLAKALGFEYSCDLRFVDLYIDEQYQGTYQLAEKIEQNESRLNIGDLNTLNNEANKIILNPDKLERIIKYDENVSGGGYVLESYCKNIISPSNITGGYIVERNYGYKLVDKPNVFTTKLGESFVVRYPDVTNEEEINYIKSIFDNVEKCLMSDNYEDKETGNKLEDLIDISSWVKKYLVDEFTKNEANGATSSYFYVKQNSQVVYGGPVWDYDKSLGIGVNERYFINGIWSNPNDLTYLKMYATDPTVWYERLYYYSEANELIKTYYSTLLKPYMDEVVDHLLNEWSDYIASSYNMNWILWKDSVMSSKTDESNDIYYSDIKNTTEYLQEWIISRIEYLDSAWIS